jgi:Flp pilus assembly protein TadB
MLGELVVVFLIALIPSWFVASFLGTRRVAQQEVDALLCQLDDEASDPLEQVVTATNSSKRREILKARAMGAAFFVALKVFTSSPSVLELVIFAGIGVLAGELVVSRRAARAIERAKEGMEFHLPLAMERVVMSVSAGLDIVPALVEASRDTDDPVSKLFRRVVELSSRGITVTDAFESVGKGVESSGIKHALVHLALAHKEGGELIRPLRELSDATQLSYQERIEEEIAKLPVKAVLPLVVTFTGLIICFLTVPLIQVSSLTDKVSQGTIE